MHCIDTLTFIRLKMKRMKHLNAHCEGSARVTYCSGYSHEMALIEHNLLVFFTALGCYHCAEAGLADQNFGSHLPVYMFTNFSRENIHCRRTIFPWNKVY